LVDVRGNERSRLSHVIDPRRTRHARSGPAAPAFPEPGDLRRIRVRKEHDRFTSRPPAWTTRPAIDAGRLDRIYKPAVARSVAVEYGAPQQVLLCVRVPVEIRFVSHSLNTNGVCHEVTISAAGGRNLSVACGRYNMPAAWVVFSRSS